MLRIRSVFCLLLASLLVAACQAPGAEVPSPILPTHTTPVESPASPPRPIVSSTAAPTVTPSDPQQKREMFAAAIDTFFGDGEVQRLFHDDRLPQHVAYIQPTFSDSKTAIPNDIVEMIVAKIEAQGLAQVPSEQSGGAVVTLSDIGSDPNAETVYQQRGPTVQLSTWVSGTSCGALIGIGYLLSRNNGGWQAQQYLVAVC